MWLHTHRFMFVHARHVGSQWFGHDTYIEGSCITCQKPKTLTLPGAVNAETIHTFIDRLHNWEINTAVLDLD